MAQSNRLRPFLLAGGAIVLANVGVVLWLLLQRPSTGQEGGGDRIGRLLDERTRSESRFDLADEPYNICLISLDALRYDRTGFGGNSRNVTPNLDRLADESVLFADATSPSAWTLPSHMSIFTGRWPSIHGVVNKLRVVGGDRLERASLSPAIQTIPEHLEEHGFICGGFTGDAGVSGEFGFSRGFDTYLDDEKFGGLPHSVPAALSWLEAHRSERFFLFLHGYDVHGQYDLASGYSGRFTPGYQGSMKGGKDEQAEIRERSLLCYTEEGGPRASDLMSEADFEYHLGLYDEKVQAADEQVGRFMDALRRFDLLSRTVVIVLADHGEEFGEHGGLDHGPTLYQEMVHVPLLIHFPGYSKQLEIGRPVRSMDALPTVLDALGIPLPGGIDAVSLLPLLRGEP
ncbi:MAG: hypothetical protein CME06_09305, partial [Gemmatimonadetes bacterium]|nr:hypothetical protein [Gemmatimonadota bacterium]